MEILSMLYTNLSGFVLGAATVGIGRLVFGVLYDKYKPIKPFMDYAELKAEELGLNTRKFALKRLGGTLGKKILLDLENSSEKIQDAYVDGLQGSL